MSQGHSNIAQSNIYSLCLLVIDINFNKNHDLNHWYISEKLVATCQGLGNHLTIQTRYSVPGSWTNWRNRRGFNSVEVWHCKVTAAWVHLHGSVALAFIDPWREIYSRNLYQQILTSGSALKARVNRHLLGSLVPS